MHLDIRTVRIRGIPIYECVVCGATEHGSMVTLELTSAAPEALAVAILNVPMSHIPIGWAACGRGVAKCPEHIT